MMSRATITGWDNEKRPVERGYPPEVVQQYCVRHKDWQIMRISLKGRPTHMKLQTLEIWYDGACWPADGVDPIVRRVQVGNYLGALRRGGQLDENNMVRRYL